MIQNNQFNNNSRSSSRSNSPIHNQGTENSTQSNRVSRQIRLRENANTPPVDAKTALNSLIEEYADNYNQSNKAKKTKIVQEIVNELRKNDVTNEFSNIQDTVLNSKIVRSFREFQKQTPQQTTQPSQIIEVSVQTPLIEVTTNNNEDESNLNLGIFASIREQGLEKNETIQSEMFDDNHDTDNTDFQRAISESLKDISRIALDITNQHNSTQRQENDSDDENNRKETFSEQQARLAKKRHTYDSDSD